MFEYSVPPPNPENLLPQHSGTVWKGLRGVVLLKKVWPCWGRWVNVYVCVCGF